MGAYIVKYEDCITDENGNVKEIHVTADLESGNGNPVDGRKIKGTIHWLSAKNASPVTLMHYDRLFTIENVGDIPEGKTYDDYLNADSAIKIEGALVEPSAMNDDATRFQFVRSGYYVKDTKNPNTFNRIVGLKDSYPKK